MKRTFIAIKVKTGENLRGLISQLRTELTDEPVKWVDTDQLHITLAFLGDTEDLSINKIKEMLLVVGGESEKFSFRISGLGLFRDIHNPRVLWAGIEKADQMILLSRSIRTGLMNIGIRTEDRNFSPHLTIGRIKFIRDTRVLGKVLADRKGEFFQDQEVDEIVFYESILRSSGPEYIPLLEARLGK